MKIYNTLSRKKEELNEIEKGKIKIYSCGPTVYNNPHIGNWRCFAFDDILRRYLIFKGYKVEHVMNITDVDDKTIRDSKKESKSLKEFTNKYTQIFFDERDMLNIEPVDHYPRATDCINDMVKLIKKLIEKGYAYKSEDGSVYFKVSKFKGYGKLSKIRFDELKAGARVNQDEYAKDSASDFALWKGYTEDDGEVYWDTEIGKGRPGWHIECSAMSSKILGQPFDIHTGGIDLIFPHHENEIAQSEASEGKQFANYWMHNEHLLVNDEKMSKSKGNFFRLKDILDKGYSPRAIRYLLISTHYRQKLNFTFEGLDQAEKALKRFDEFISKLKDSDQESNPKIESILKKAEDHFINAMDDDLNISGALAAIYDLMKEINKTQISKDDADRCLDLIKRLDSVLAIFSFKEESIPPEIESLAEERWNAKQQKNYSKADDLRDEIKSKGYIIDDSKDGYKIKKA